MLVFNGTILEEINATLTTGSSGIGAAGAVTGLTTYNITDLTLTNASLTATQAFTETFSGTSQLINGSFQNVFGGFSLSNGSTVDNAATSDAVVQGISVTNATVSATGSIPNANTCIGLIQRYQGPGDTNMYLAQICNISSSYYYYLYVNNAGTWTVLNNGILPTSFFASPLTFSFTVQNFSLTLSAMDAAGNNAQISGATDTTLTKPGQIGFRAYGTGIFTSFSAAEVSTPTQTLPFTASFSGALAFTLGGPFITQLGLIGIESNQLSTFGSTMALATVNGVSVADSKQQMTIPSLAVGSYAGMSARWAGPGDENQYWAALYQKDTSTTIAVLYVNSKGTWTEITSYQLTLNAASGGTFEFDVVGNLLIGSFTNSATPAANELVFNETDSTVTAAGSVGVRGLAFTATGYTATTP